MATPVLGQHSAVATSLDPYGTSRRSVEGERVKKQRDWVRGTWENIGPKPVFIRDKHHLKEVIMAENKRTGKNLIPKAFMKSSSQGKGVEWNF